MGRSLFCLGLLIRYGNSLLSFSSNKLLDVGSSLGLFKKYLLMDDFVIKVRSLQVITLYPLSLSLSLPLPLLFSFVLGSYFEEFVLMLRCDFVAFISSAGIRLCSNCKA